MRGDWTTPQLRGLGAGSEPRARRLPHRLGPGVSERHLWPSEPVPARRPGAARARGSTPTTGRLYGLRRARDAAAGRLRHLRPRRLRPGDLRRLRAGGRQRRRAPPVRRLPRDRAGRLVPHPQHRLPLPLRRRQRLPRLPEARRLRDLRRSRDAERPTTSPAGSAARPRGGASSPRARCSSSRSTASGPGDVIAKDGPRVRTRCRSACGSSRRSRRSPTCRSIVNGRVVDELDRPRGQGAGRLDRARAGRSI